MREWRREVKKREANLGGWKRGKKGRTEQRAGRGKLPLPGRVVRVGEASASLSSTNSVTAYPGPGRLETANTHHTHRGSL